MHPCVASEGSYWTENYSIRHVALCLSSYCGGGEGVSTLGGFTGAIRCSRST